MAQLTEKETAIRDVISRRIDCITKNILPNVKDRGLTDYYSGKLDGLRQAFVLIGESLESIKIEL